MPTTWKQDEDGMGDKAVDRGRWGEEDTAWYGISLLYGLPTLFSLIGSVLSSLFPRFRLFHTHTIVIRHPTALTHVHTQLLYDTTQHSSTYIHSCFKTTLMHVRTV